MSTQAGEPCYTGSTGNLALGQYTVGLIVNEGLVTKKAVKAE